VSFLLDNKRLEDLQRANMIREGIPQIVWPWRIWAPVTLMMEYDIVEGNDVVLIEVFFASTKEWAYWCRVPLPPYIAPDAIPYLVLNTFRDQFRNWRPYEPEPNIVLGEE